MDVYNLQRLVSRPARALLIEAGEIIEAFERYADRITEAAQAFVNNPLDRGTGLVILDHLHILYVGDELLEHTQTATTGDLPRAHDLAYALLLYLDNRHELRRPMWLEMGLHESQSLKNTDNAEERTVYQKREIDFLNAIGLLGWYWEKIAKPLNPMSKPSP